jgi:hypothetical protein
VELELFKPMWLRAFQCLRSLPGVKPRLVRFGETSVLIAFLLAPSIWMLIAIPPLWKDVDAYVQVAHPPGIGTILQYGPLYCFVARIPLYLGYAIDCIRIGAPLPTRGFFFHPTLSDSGVFVLLLSQHVLLCLSVFYLIAVTSRLFLVRLVLVVAWAASPLFYTFAHCVGSETLSMILLLLVGATGLKIIRHPRRIPWKEWLLFGVLLWLCILTRHINSLLAALIPLTFFVLSAQRFAIIPSTRSKLFGRWRRLRVRQDLQKATVAVAIGFSCIAFANISLLALCRAAHIPYEFRVGFTFMWRLKFLATLRPEVRNRLLDNVAKNTDSPDVKKVICLLREAFPEAPNWDVMGFMRKVQSSLFTPGAVSQDEKMILVLNRTARAFLYPPEKIFLSAVAADFTKSRKATIPSVVNWLFLSTTWYFSHSDTMPGCASLITFHKNSATQIFAIFKNHSYLHRPKIFSYNAFLFFWFTNLLLLSVVAKVRKEDVAALCSYAAALTLVGSVMMLATCFLDAFQARFTLPMWELTIVSASVLVGRTIECFFSPQTQLHPSAGAQQSNFDSDDDVSVKRTAGRPTKYSYEDCERNFVQNS